MKKNILLAEDDKTVRAVVMATLGEEAYRLFPAMTAKRTFEILQAESVDLVLLDLILPDANGLDLIEPIRQNTNVPIIILSAKNSVPDKITGLERGVDDYVGKPFHPTELRARIEANIHRYAQLNGDPDQGRLTKDNTDKFTFDG